MNFNFFAISNFQVALYYLPAIGPIIGRFFCDKYVVRRSEEHTSELQSLAYLVCRLLLEKKTKFSEATPRNINHQRERVSIGGERWPPRSTALTELQTDLLSEGQRSPAPVETEPRRRRGR